MSCEENRFKYFERVSIGGGALANALGGEGEAKAALEQIFNTARSDGAAIRSPLQQHKAAGRTLQLFEEMERRHGLARPTHSTKGMRLPRRDAQFGYQAVYDTIEAARSGRSLPEVAVRVLQQRQLRRNVTSVRLDDHGYYRCSSCGQFASRTRGHVCPLTASSADLESALQRRLGTPTGAYLYTNDSDNSDNSDETASKSQRADGLQELISVARAAPSGTVRMIHCLTGEEAAVTLDGAIPALSQGFVPDIWVGRPSLRHVELSDRRVVVVLDAGGLNAIYPTSVLGVGGAAATHAASATAVTGTAHSGDGVSGSAVRIAAAAYGATLAPNSHVYSLGAPRVAPLVGTATPLVRVARAGIGGTPSDRGAPGVPGTHGALVPLKPTTLQGGTPYDWGRFTGTEYRKSGSQGVQVSACGRLYKVGDRSTDPNDWAHARRMGAEPTPKGGMAVGRTLVAAVDLLSKGRTLVSGVKGNGVNSNGTDNQVQLYNADGSELVAVYDHTTHTAGDTAANSNASPAQMAAAIAYWEHLGRSRPDLSSPAVRSLLADLDSLRQGGGSPLAVADSAYLVLRDYLRTGSAITLGANVSTPRCPDCGRWMGDVHNCPAQAQSQPAVMQPQVQTQTQPQVPPQVPPQVQPPLAAPVPPMPTRVEPQQGTSVTEAGAPVIPQAPAVAATAAAVEMPNMPNMPNMPDASYPATALVDVLGDAFDRLGDRLGEKLGSVLGERLGEKLDTARPSPVQAAESLSAVDERMAFALERLAAILQERTSSPVTEAGETLSDATAPDLTTPEREAGRGRTPAGARVDDPRSMVPMAAMVTRDAIRVRRPVPPPTPPAPPAPPARPPLDEVPLTPQEHILMNVKPPALPDPYLSRLDASLGGQRAEPLPLHYEEIDTTYDVSESAEKALRIVSSSLQMAWDANRPKPLRGTQMRVFGFAGTAGTGKNTTARQIAASLRLPYYETTLHRDSSLQEEIGQTVLRDGTTVPRLGPLGQAAAAGGVICINELVKANPGTLGALQRMMEDGVFEVQGTEAGISAKEIPVHPSTVFVCTWNPGYDGSSDRPDAALLSRIPTIKLDAPDIKDETRRIVGSLAMLFGDADGEGGDRGNGGEPDSKASQQKEERRREILGQDYGVRKSRPSLDRVEVAVRFVRDLRNLAQTRQIGASSRHLLEPTPREALHFAAMCEATGDPLLALESFKIYCDSGEGYDEQFKLVQQIFKRYYGEDGQALNRRASGDGPQQS